jgi:hypothetical protein
MALFVSLWIKVTISLDYKMGTESVRAEVMKPLIIKGFKLQGTSLL